MKVVADQVLFTEPAKTGAQAAEDEAPAPAPRRPMAPVASNNDDQPPF